MGKKKDAGETPVPEAPKESNEAEKAEGEEEDTPVIKELKSLDEQYCAIQVELEKEIEKLNKQFDEKRRPLEEERRKVLMDDSSCGETAKDFGTPGCEEFWFKALSNASEIQECVHECDEPVLKYLSDIRKSNVDAEDSRRGQRLEFHFKANPYFTNDVLWYETTCDLENYKPWKDIDVVEIKSCTIDWKPGKNVTVEKKQSAPAKKGKKSGGRPKTKEEPCPSIFRILFNSIKKDDELPDALNCIYDEDGEADDDLAEMHLENMGEVTHFFTEALIPYAVRYYTGEACDDDDDDDEDEESESEDDPDEEEDDSDDEPPPTSKKNAKGKAGAKSKGAEAADGKKTEECKQQ